MVDKINEILSEVKTKIEQAGSESELQSVKGAFVGKQGSLSMMMKELPKLDASLRPQMGKMLNQAKNQVTELIDNKSMLLIDDSIVRGTQLRETTEYLYKSGAKEVHVRPACPPLVFGCKYLNFSRSNSEGELITRRMIEKLEGSMDPEPHIMNKYMDPDSEEYAAMLEEIRKELNFSSLHYHRLDDMIEAIGIEPCNLCTYCWNGIE